MSINFLKSEILNNKNLNAKMNVSTNTFKDINFINKINFNIITKVMETTLWSEEERKVDKTMFTHACMEDDGQLSVGDDCLPV